MPPEGLPRTDDQLGPYRLLRELGRGGQAVVWLAEDPRIGRKIALKVLPALGPGSEAILRRFQREASVTSRLEHPAICPVYEADLQGGVPFIAMRYVEGETLARRIARAREAGGRAVVLQGDPPQPPDWNGIATFFARVARALHLAHEAGVVHRDIKPANVMVTPEGEPVILDFGLARQDDPDSQALSLSGEHSGTPTYMSPEQMTGRVRPDRRSDVYSLGCALFECLTGRPPFEAATLEGLFHAILNEDAPSARSVHGAVPEDLAVITATAAEKERERRYKTTLDLALDLERFTRLLPIQARPVTRMERVVRWSRRNPALAGSLAAVVLLLLLATGLLSYGVGASGRAELQGQLRDRAETERKNAEAERQRMVQIAADKELAGRMDELNMQLGTLMFGFEHGAETAVVLAPDFEAIARDAGIDLRQADGAAQGKARIDALRARSPDAASVLSMLLDNMAVFQDSLEPGVRKNLLALLAGCQDPLGLEMAKARGRWEKDKVDEFAPFLTKKALDAMSPDQLAQLAGLLSDVTGREHVWRALLDRALLKRPDSFPYHFMYAGLQIRRAAADMEDPDAIPAAHSAVEHLQAAVALRPRSGLARAALASAQAIQATVTKDTAGYRTAWETLQTATEVEPNTALVWYLRASFLSRSPMGKSQAIAACRKALELRPGFTPAQVLLDEIMK